MSLDTHGFAELAGQIERMANALNTADEGAPAAKRILRAAAVPIDAQMKANASSDPKIITGALHGAINIGKVKKRKSGGQHITIGVHRKDWSNPDYVPAYVEYGHGGPGPAPAHPFQPMPDITAPVRHYHAAKQPRQIHQLVVVVDVRLKAHQLHRKDNRQRAREQPSMLRISLEQRQNQHQERQADVLQVEPEVQVTERKFTV